MRAELGMSVKIIYPYYKPSFSKKLGFDDFVWVFYLAAIPLWLQSKLYFDSSKINMTDFSQKTYLKYYTI